MQSERRQQRATNLSDAMTLLFDSIADRFGIDALALADGDGLLLAAHGDLDDCDTLAAYAPVVSRASDAFVRRDMLDRLDGYLVSSSGSAIEVTPVGANDEMFICAVASRQVDRTGVVRAITGVQRICSEMAA